MHNISVLTLPCLTWFLLEIAWTIGSSDEKLFTLLFTHDTTRLRLTEYFNPATANASARSSMQPGTLWLEIFSLTIKQKSPSFL